MSMTHLRDEPLEWVRLDRCSDEPRPSGGAFIQYRFAACHAAEQLHQVPDLDAFERAHGILDFAADAFVGAAGHEPVEFLDRILPREWMGSEARVILNLVLDHSVVL